MPLKAPECIADRLFLFQFCTLHIVRGWCGNASNLKPFCPSWSDKRRQSYCDKVIDRKRYLRRLSRRFGQLQQQVGAMNGRRVNGISAVSNKPPCQCTSATCKKTFQENYFDACNMMEQVKGNTKLIIPTYTKYTVHLRSFEHSVATNKCHIESYRSLSRQ